MTILYAGISEVLLVKHFSQQLFVKIFLKKENNEAVLKHDFR